jgi:hypothetical protein
MIKKLLFPALLGVMTMFAACEADPCKDLDGKCGTGTCFEGTCVCDEFYEADAEGICNVEWATKFVGTYTGQDICPSGTYQLSPSAQIAKTAVDKVSITNFAGFNSIVKATVSKAATTDESAVKLTIDDTDAAGRKFVGTATLAGKVLTGSYVVTIDGAPESCTFTYTQQ